MRDVDQVGAHRGDHAGLRRDGDVTGVHRTPVLHPGAHEGGVGTDQGDGLALHVRTHQGPGGVVVLEERDHRGGHGDHLPRRHVHVVHVFGRDLVGLTVTPADQHPLLGEAALLVQLGVGLGDDEAVLDVGGHVLDLVGDPTLLHLAVRSLDEPEGVHPGEAGQRADQADVRAFRRLDGTHPAVVRGVHVAHLHAGPIPGQTARTERGEPPLVGQARDRVGLVHELAELGGAEELLQRRHHRPDVDQGLRRDRLDVLGRHPVPDHPLHPAEAGAQLVLDQLTHRTQPAIAEVVDVVLFDDQLTRAGPRGSPGPRAAPRRSEWPPRCPRW